MALSLLSQCHGVIRSRSLLFQQLKRQDLGETAGSQESRRVMLLSGVQRSEREVEEVELTPIWSETYAKGNELLGEIEGSVQRLKELQKQRLQTAFGDLRTLDRDINLQASAIRTVPAQQSSSSTVTNSSKPSATSQPPTQFPRTSNMSSPPGSKHSPKPTVSSSAAMWSD